MADKKKYTSKVEPLQIFPLIGPQGAGGKLPTVKGTPLRKEYADLKRAHHTKQRILKARAGRQQAAKVAAGTAKLQAKHPSFKGLAARSKYPKTFRRKGIT